MAAMTTVLNDYAEKWNQKSYWFSGHTAAKPRLFLQKRTPIQGNETVLQDSVLVRVTAEDSDGVVLSAPIALTVTCRRPHNAISADVSAAKAAFRDFVASDEFDNMMDNQAYAG